MNAPRAIVIAALVLAVLWAGWVVRGLAGLGQPGLIKMKSEEAPGSAR